jgi:hypothetical protein
VAGINGDGNGDGNGNGNGNGYGNGYGYGNGNGNGNGNGYGNGKAQPFLVSEYTESSLASAVVVSQLITQPHVIKKVFICPSKTIR